MIRTIQAGLLLLIFVTLCTVKSGIAVAEEKAASKDTPAAEFMGVDVCEACHEEISAQMLMNPHGQATDSRTPYAHDGCESCHGAGSVHVDEDGEPGTLLGLRRGSGEPVEQQNAACLQCHRDSSLTNWRASTHESEDLACSSCHAIHTPDAVLERSTQAEFCYQCHPVIRAQAYRAYRHPIREAKTICSDCHNAHGSPGPHELIQLTLNQNCYQCHPEKRGPFLWEHYPVTEDCSLCHRAHGSNHPALLTRQGPQLCQQCHQEIRSQGSQHIRNYFGFEGDPPKRGRFIVGENCMNCHSQVHGSNHPSGTNLLR